MPVDNVAMKVSDSRIALARPTRPESFTALMGLYESNYVRLGWLLGQLDRLSGEHRSDVTEDLPLHVIVRDVQRYTTTLHLTYWFDVHGDAVADPDLSIRIYHDARLAEAMSCRNNRRHSVLRGFDTDHGSELKKRWMRNMMLNKWLEYCSDLGHRFDGLVQRPE